MVSSTDEAELAKQLAALEEENREVGGDSDEDSYSEGEGGDGSEGEENEAE